MMLMLRWNFRKVKYQLAMVLKVKIAVAGKEKELIGTSSFGHQQVGWELMVEVKGTR